MDLHISVFDYIFSSPKPTKSNFDSLKIAVKSKRLYIDGKASDFSVASSHISVVFAVVKIQLASLARQNIENGRPDSTDAQTSMPRTERSSDERFSRSL